MAERLFQIGVKALITNSEGEILLIQNHKGYWDIPGGRMDNGESFMDTLARELNEEAGIHSFSKPVFFETVLSNITIDTSGGPTGLVLLIYQTNLPVDTEIVLGEEEAEYEWATSAHAAERLGNKYPPEFTQKLANLTNN